MAELTNEEIRVKVVEYLQTTDKAKNKDIAKAIGVDKKEATKAINELANEGTIEFLYLGTSYVTLAKK
ncbi:winged helix-turn-helix transcriptional regulator [Desulfonispora thiosulfatigenes]|nr:winged helix-turn-helix transcriptional regulator [Desulfonispora thiosulfatigenes]